MILTLGSALFIYVYKLSRTYGEHGLMKKIAKKGNDLSGSVKEGIGKIGESINNKYQNIKGDAKEMMNDAMDNGIEVKEDHYGQKSF